MTTPPTTAAPPAPTTLSPADDFSRQRMQYLDGMAEDMRSRGLIVERHPNGDIASISPPEGSSVCPHCGEVIPPPPPTTTPAP